MTIPAGNRCLEAFEELKRFCRTLASRPPLTVQAGPLPPATQPLFTGEFMSLMSSEHSN